MYVLQEAAPLFSVVIPVHNQAAWVAAAVASALDQHETTREVIVVDDGSTDSLAVAMAGFQGKIELIHQPHLGPAAARNHGASRARGRWLIFLDADDVLLPGSLETHRVALGPYPDADLSIGSFALRTLDGRTVTTDVAAKLRPGQGHAADQTIHVDGFRMECVRGVHVGAYCVSRRLFDHMRGFDESLQCWEIMDFAIRALLDARGTVVSNRTLLFVTETQDSQFSRARRTASYLARVSSNLLGQLARVPDEEKTAYCRQLACLIYQLWDIGALAEYRALGLRENFADAWRSGGKRFSVLAALPVPVLQALWRLRRIRDRVACNRKSARLLLKGSAPR
jgi:glycosyltransferase involved in cell wall biosynthesis